MSEKFLELPPADELRSQLSYDPDTGVIVRISTGRVVCAREQVFVCGRHWIMARVIWKMMTGRDPVGIIDHKNRVPTDHRWSNLREATRSQNNSNVGLRRDNQSGVVGVRRYQWNKDLWVADIRKDGVLYRSEKFETMEEAVEWRKRKSIELHGEFSGGD